MMRRVKAKSVSDKIVDRNQKKTSSDDEHDTSKEQNEEMKQNNIEQEVKVKGSKEAEENNDNYEINNRQTKKHNCDYERDAPGILQKIGQVDEKMSQRDDTSDTLFFTSSDSSIDVNEEIDGNENNMGGGEDTEFSSDSESEDDVIIGGAVENGDSSDGLCDSDRSQEDFDDLFEELDDETKENRNKNKESETSQNNVSMESMYGSYGDGSEIGDESSISDIDGIRKSESIKKNICSLRGHKNEYDAQKLKKKLKINVQILAMDHGGKESYNATVVEPGVEGENVWISWISEKKRFPIPIYPNVVEIFQGNDKFLRSTSRQSAIKRRSELSSEVHQLHSNKRQKKLSTSEATTVVTPCPRKTRQRQKSLPILHRPYKLVKYEGAPVLTVSSENNIKMQYFLKYKFNGCLIKVEGELNGETQKLEKEKWFNDECYHLVITKLKEKALNTAIQERSSKRWYVAYYVGGDNILTASDVQMMLEELGDFSKIALLPGKVCSRLELLVTPSVAKYAGFFQLQKDEFEMIEENQHVGCGFAPPNFFKRILNLTSRMHRDDNYSALQVRIFSPALGWFKGVLMKKLSIKKVQLPSSMRKVEKSVLNVTDDSVYVQVKQCYPYDNSKAWQRELTGESATKSQKKKIKDIGDQYKNLLFSNGLSWEDLSYYEGLFKGENNELLRTRDDAILVGVADPTSSLPKDTIFIKDVKPTYNDQVFITRYPCTEKKDGKVVKIVNRRPQGMSKENWDFLQSIPFGLVFFGPSSTEISMPEEINDGDLDGDLYHVLWNKDLIEKIAYFSSSTAEPISLSSDWNKKDTENDRCIDRCIDNDNRDIVLQILDYRREKGRHEVKVRWEKRQSGIVLETWEPFDNLKNEAKELMAEYALEANIFDEKDPKPKWMVAKWNWAKKVIGTSVALFIASHENQRGDNEDDIIVTLRFNDGDNQFLTVGEMKEEDPEMLYKYALKKNILSEWREKFVADNTKNWFEVAQDYASELKLLYHQADMKEWLHRLYKKSLIKGDIENANHFSQAYKKSLDFRKHGTEIKLPFHLINSLPRRLQHYVLNSAMDM